MIVLVALLALQSMEVQQEAGEDVIVSSIQIRTAKLDAKELKVAVRYAHCISLPYFPLESEYGKKRERCRKPKSVRKSGAELAKILGHVDGIVREDPGSEASLTVIKDGASKQ